MAGATFLSDNDYERFRVLILERSGLHFPEKRRRDLEVGLRKALERAGLPDLEEYYRFLLRSLTSGQEWEHLISQLTIGETHFFRNRPHFDALSQLILPEIVAQKGATTRQLRIWSAGCATGEEPYSVAMLLQDCLPEIKRWSVTILATDINREALARAREGLYGEWSFRGEGYERVRSRFFSQRGSKWQLSPEIRDMVTFGYLNLVEDPFPSLANNTVAFDLILCRNVTIYFTPEITQRLADQFFEALVEGGWLIVGHSEPSLTLYARFAIRNTPGAVLYQKRGTPPRMDLSWLESIERTGPAAAVSPRPAERAMLPVLPTKPVVQAAVLPTAPPVSEPAPPADPCHRAVALLDQGRTEEALKELQQVLEKHPDCAQACYLMSKVCADGGRWEDAQRWCECALERDLLMTKAHFLLGLIYSQEGHMEQALGSMKRVVYLDRNAVLGHYWLAELYEERGDRARARKSRQNAAQLLQAMPPEEMIPWSDGMTAGRLLYTIQLRLENGSSR